MGDEGWYHEGLAGLEDIDGELVDMTSKLSQQVNVFASETARLNGRLVLLETDLPETAPEGRTKRQYSVQVEVLHNKIKEVGRALEVLKITLGQHYKPTPAPQQQPFAPAQPSVAPEADQVATAGAAPRRLSLSDLPHNPARQEGPPEHGTNVAVGGPFGCARQELEGGRPAKSARR